MELMEIAEGLAELDPLVSYSARGVILVARAAKAEGYRLELSGETPIGDLEPNEQGKAVISLPIEYQGFTRGTLHLQLSEQSSMESLRWALRLFCRGLEYSARLNADGEYATEETVVRSLKKAPLTPRERDVVSLLISGASTREIAEDTNLTVSTVNTYLKRIFSKLGVHSRVELVARMTGTDSLLSLRAGKPNRSGRTEKVS